MKSEIIKDLEKNLNIIKYSEINPRSLKMIFSQLSLECLADCSLIRSKSEEFLSELAYPDISSWYDKVIMEVEKNSNEREIFISLANKDNTLFISGLMILKNTIDEKKICTLRVKDEYQGQGIGSSFFKEAFKFLGTDKPLITVPEESDKAFSKVLLKYGFEKTEEILGLYRPGKMECIYNGHFK